MTDQSSNMNLELFPWRRLLTRLLESWRWALALPLAAVVLLGACGGGDDDDAAADSKGDSKSSSSGATGSDDKFVADICKGFATFAASAAKISADPGKLKDEKSAIEAFSKPFEQLAKDFSNARPPKDMKDWHKQASDSLNKAAAAIKNGSGDGLSR